MRTSHRVAGLFAAALTAAAAACGPTHAGATGGADPFAGQKLYVDPQSPAAENANSMRQSNPHDAAELDKIAHAPQADWFGDWNSTDQVTSTVAHRGRTIHDAGALPVFVVYDIPERDCNGYSGGGAPSPAAYRTWIRDFTAGVGTGRAAIVLEPDALAMMDCLSAADQATRLSLLRYAVQTLTSHPRTAVYVDAGHSGWIPADQMAVRLREADVLVLVRQGLTNKEIAERLYLSPRTVEKHIESLLRKTAARSRTQLATLADQSDSGAP